MGPRIIQQKKVPIKLGGGAENYVDSVLHEEKEKKL